MIDIMTSSWFSELYKIILRIYFTIRTTRFVWFYALNYRARSLFKKNKPNLNPTQTRIVNDLQKLGISLTNLDELFPGENLLGILKKYTESQYARAQTTERKKFLKDLWDPEGILDLNNPFIKIALNKKVLDIVNSYMQMWTKFKYATLQTTVPVPQGSEAQESQRWHRDPQEKRMCKMFIYLNDVDEGAGPFIYIRASTYGNKWGYLFPQKPPLGSYPPQEKIEELIPSEERTIATGKAGTVIFCDTSGLHKGGYATTKERIMFTAFYTAPTFKEKSWYKLPQNFQELSSKLEETVKFALS